MTCVSHSNRSPIPATQQGTFAVCMGDICRMSVPQAAEVAVRLLLLQRHPAPADVRRVSVDGLSECFNQTGVSGQGRGRYDVWCTRD